MLKLTAISRSRISRFLTMLAICGLLSYAEFSLGSDLQSSSDSTSSVQVSALAAAKLLVEASQLRLAHALLENFRPVSEEDKIERLFLLGTVEKQLGQFARAAERFETILAEHPHLARVRLELAQTYYLAGQDDQSEFHFQSVLAAGLPSSVESKVEAFLRHIDDRKPLSVYFSMALQPSTNPAKRSDENSIQIGGIPFTLSQQAQKSSGLGVLVSAGASFAPSITNTLRGHLAASTSSKIYERSDWNDLAVTGEVGLTRLFEESRRSGGLRLSRRWLASEPYSRRTGLWFRAHSQMHPSMQVGISVETNAIRYNQNSGGNGYEFKIIPHFRFAVGSRTAVALELITEFADAEQDHRSYGRFGVNWNLKRNYASGLAVSVNPFAAYSSYGAADPLFGKIRKDRQLSIGVKLQQRNYQVRGFSPSIGFVYEKNSSSIPIHSFQNFSIILDLTKTF